MNKRTIFIVIGIVLAVAGFLFLTKPAEQAEGSLSNHTVGSDSSGVVLVEYGDFQCPACGAYHPILKEVKDKYKDLVKFQFRHFPLEQIHKNARAAARAAEAAAIQGKFWEMHDLLFENQNQWSETSDPLGTFESFAQAAGVADMAKFTADYKSGTVNGVINADMNEGKRLGATSTPTFVLDGKKLDENPDASVEAFSKVLDDAIKAKGGTPPAAQTDSTDQ